MMSNRTLEYIKNFNYVERNHWQLMADLSNNDYDIGYFGGRATVCDNFDYFIQTQENFDLDNFIDYLNRDLQECTNLYKCNNTNENYKGCLDELNLLIRIVKQKYC